MATLQKTTNQCEARLGGEYKRWEERECRRALQNAGKHTNGGTSCSAGRHVPSTRGGENWDTCYK